MKWIKEPKTEPEIFINDFMNFGSVGEVYANIVKNKFTNGYCWYFAHMLKNAFERGQVCWTAPDNHFVWQDTDGRTYDIKGFYNQKSHDCRYLIPEEYVGHFLNDFKHTISAQNATHMTKEDLTEIVKQYCSDNGITYDTSIEDFLD